MSFDVGCDVDMTDEVSIRPTIDNISEELLNAIFTYLTLQDLSRLVSVCSSWHSHIETDKDKSLWIHFSKNHQWSKNLAYDELFQKDLRKYKSGWKRFLSVFADNYCKWISEPCWDEDIKNKLQFSDDGCGVKVIDSENMNVSACASFPIVRNTVKYFEILMTKKSVWNVAIGVTELSFLQLKRKFCGFNCQNWGYSSNGWCREFCVKTASACFQEPGMENFTSGDVIGILADMRSHQLSIYRNSKLIKTFKSLYLLDNTPLHVTCTLHFSEDQVNLIHDEIMFDKQGILYLYQQLEHTLSEYWKTIEEKKKELHALIDKILLTGDDVILSNAIQSLNNVL
ncbi:ssh4 [Acrasis kona]|uniref:Ssh4 n=1 Tax=Acrasis kona TaxID=1008807 RepID=A0AAW2Z5V6_9EUKA